MRKYSKEVKTDPDVFENCTQTIIRQVGSLEQMVNEFSAFARMPAPNFNHTSLKNLIDNAVFAQGVAFPDISFPIIDGTASELFVKCDERLITQALTNIYKNAGESVLRRVNEDGVDEHEGQITTEIRDRGNTVLIRITDNGVGWPFRDKDRLLEPYVTTRESGTGLGLAIVMRIAEDHGGRITLKDRDDSKQGAVIDFTLPMETSAQAEDAANDTDTEHTYFTNYQ